MVVMVVMVAMIRTQEKSKNERGVNNIHASSVGNKVIKWSSDKISRISSKYSL